MGGTRGYWGVLGDCLNRHTRRDHVFCVNVIHKRFDLRYPICVAFAARVVCAICAICAICATCMKVMLEGVRCNARDTCLIKLNESFGVARAIHAAHITHIRI